MAVIRTAREFAPLRGLYATRSIVMPSAVHTSMERRTAAAGGSPAADIAVKVT